MHHDLIPANLFAQLVSHGLWSQLNRGFDPPPLVKLRLPGTPSVWLLRDVDPTDIDRVFALADHGTGTPILGYYSLASLRDVCGHRVEVDPDFHSDRPFSELAYESARAGRLVA